jgi:hypothetical protein
VHAFSERRSRKDDEREGSEEQPMDMSPYDSDTGASLESAKIVDITHLLHALTV